ncbi:glycosyltransferase family 4 protein [Vibrio vulnificus]
MNRIKIFVDGHVLDGKPQGTCSYIAGLYGALSKNENFEIYVATNNYESIIKYFGGNNNVKWVKLNSKSKYFRLAYELTMIERKIKPDFSHYQYITPLFKFGRWINTIHDLLFIDFPSNFPLKYRLINYLLFKISAIRSDVILTVSSYSKNRISKHFNIKENDIVVTPNAVDNILSFGEESIGFLENEKFFIYVSRIEPRKNQDLLARAFLMANIPLDTKLVLVGAKSLAYPLLDDLLKNDRIVHLEGISNENLVWLYKNAKASLYPSKCEGFGIPPLEAAILGCKSFCAKNTALTELSSFVDGTFNCGNIEEIKTIIELVIQDSNLEQASGKKIMDQFNWGNVASEFINAINKSESNHTL